MTHKIPHEIYHHYVLYKLGQKDLEAIHSPLSVASTDFLPSPPPMPEEQSDALPLHLPTYEEAIGALNGNIAY